MLKVKLLAYTPDAESIVASAAKLCYSPVGVEEIMEKQSRESIVNFIDKLSSISHYSPFEHATFTFAIEGVSRTTEIQLARHRIASYSIQSGRYVNRENPEFTMPPAIFNNEKAKKIYLKQMKSAQKAYDDLTVELILEQLEAGNLRDEWLNFIRDNKFGLTEDELEVDLRANLLDFKNQWPKEFSVMEKKAIENARYVHPQAITTKIVATMNARSLMNFFGLRCCNRAQWEIRTLADMMLREVYNVAPAIFSKSGAPCTNGKCPEGHMTCGQPRKLDDILGVDSEISLEQDSQLSMFE